MDVAEPMVTEIGLFSSGKIATSGGNSLTANACRFQTRSGLKIALGRALRSTEEKRDIVRRETVKTSG